jgi:hypothetical protein
MLFMVIEHFRDNDMVPVYRRLRQDGRSLPEGLEYVDSWVETNFSRCFQLMRCDDLRLIQAWILGWRDCGVTFEIVPVVTSAEARETQLPQPQRTQPWPREVDGVTLWVSMGRPRQHRPSWEKLKPMSLSLYEQRSSYERGLNAFLAILDRAEGTRRRASSIRITISPCG